MDRRENMKTFIVESTDGQHTFYSIVEANDVEEAVAKKVDSIEIGRGKVTGVTHSIHIGQWGEFMQDVTFIEETVTTSTLKLTDR